MAETVHLAGGNNITLSTAAGVDATSITISGANLGGAQTGISSIVASDATFTSGQVVFTGTNNVTVLSGANQSVIISGANTHAQQTGISGISVTDTNYTSGTVRITGSNLVTVKSSAANQTVIIDATNQNLSVGLSTGGNTAGDTGVATGSRFVLSGQGQVTLSQATGAGATTVGVSIPNSHAQQTAISGVQASDATYTSGTVIISGGNNITVSSGANQSINIHGPASHAQQTGISGISVTDTNYTSGTVRITGSGLVTVQSSAANQTVIINATNQNLSAGVSTGGNTGGDTGVATGSRLVFLGSNNITLSQSTGAGATTIGINGGAGEAGGSFSGGVSNLGNTAGSTGITGTQNVFVGTGDISLSQSTGANGGTISIVPGPVLNMWNNRNFEGNNPANITINGSQNSMIVMPLNGGQPFPGVITANTMFMYISQSGSTATMSTPNTTTLAVGVYTNNANTLSLLNSVTTTWGAGAGNTANSTSTVGMRALSFHSSLWSSQPVFTRGEYWLATFFATSSRSNQTVNLFGQLWAFGAAQFSGTAGVTYESNATRGFSPFAGAYSVTTNAFPAAIQSNDISKTLSYRSPIYLMHRVAPETF